MQPVAKDAASGSIAINARIATVQERAAMTTLVAKHDTAKRELNYPELMATFAKEASFEVKPTGVRMNSADNISELYQRTLPKLTKSLLSRRKLREWTNQTGMIREWEYPTTLPSGKEVFTKQLEIFEFSADLTSITAYRIRMNIAYGRMFEDALGHDFSSRTGIEKIFR